MKIGDSFFEAGSAGKNASKWCHIWGENARCHVYDQVPHRGWRGWLSHLAFAMNDPDLQLILKTKKSRAKPIPPRKKRKGRSRPIRVAISLKTRFEIFQRDHFTCRYCGGRSPDVALQIDHVIAVANGGRNTQENLVTACFSCNLGKSANRLCPAGLMQAGCFDNFKSQAATIPSCELESIEFLRHLCALKVRLSLRNGKKILSVGDIVRHIARQEEDADVLANEGGRALASIGIKVEVETVAIANRSRELSMLLHETKWELDWRRPLRMTKGATVLRRPIYFAPGLFSRATALPLDALWSVIREAEG